jgi:hypothetical protein
MSFCPRSGRKCSRPARKPSAVPKPLTPGYVYGPVFTEEENHE